MRTQSRVRAVCVLALLLSIAYHVTLAHALTYYFTDGTPLCFSEVIENLQETQITGTYNWIANKDYPPAGVNLKLTVSDATTHPHYGKTMSEGEHSFAIVLDPAKVVPGEQLICFTPSDKFVAKETNPLKLRVDLDQVVKNKLDKEKALVENIRQRRQVDGLDVFTFREAGGQLKVNLQPREYLEKIEGALESMERALDLLVADLNTSVKKESRMRQTSESTFTRVWVCAVLLIAVITGVLWMEFRFLKSTLRKKKLV